LFQIEDGGSLQIMGLNISGEDSPDNAGNSVIRTSSYSMLQNYRLEIIDSNFSDIDINHSFNVVSVAKGTFADNILIKGSSFSDVTGSNIGGDKRNKTKSSLYLHGVQVTNITGNTFADSQPFVINHTVGEPKTRITNNSFKNVSAPIVVEMNSGLEDTSIVENNTGLK